MPRPAADIRSRCSVASAIALLATCMTAYAQQDQPAGPGDISDVPETPVQAEPPETSPGPTAGPSPSPAPAPVSTLGPASIPPAPNMLETAPALAPMASPLLMPRLSATRSGDLGLIDPADEPLWVLPPNMIPDYVSTRPGSEPVRDRGYLDNPAGVAKVVTEPIDADSGRLHADLDWNYCGSNMTPSVPEGSATTGAQYTDLDAGGVRYRRQADIIDATGGVTVVRGDQRVEADSLSFDRGASTIVSPSRSYLQYPDIRLVGDSLEANLQTKQGRVDAPRFRLSGNANARGAAATAYVVSPERTAYQHILYTTCPPGSNAWSLKAGKLKLDQYAGLGVARDARLRIRGLPVLYTPYLRFPIDDRRRSGFLVPSFGSSEDNGIELQTPYYWNIAPQLDATFFPRLMSKRGFLLGSEFRYLTRSDKGTIRAEILPDDQLYEDGDSTRWAVQLMEDGLWLGRLRTEVDFAAVSDDQYLEDLGNNIDASSSRRLRQFGRSIYNGKGWSLLAQLEDYQTLDQGSEPYARLPQVSFLLKPAAMLPAYAPNLTGALEAEYDLFQHDTQVQGQRFTVTPIVAWPLRQSFGHLIPSARLYFSTYDLTDTVGDQPASPSHTIPSLDLDGKLIFERSTGWLGSSAVQTLEPRLYYLYTPYADQSDTPVFDSSELDFSFSNLFRNNRFTGRDRIGDANQVTAAVTSRMLQAATGEELWRISLGQIYYFADRRVQTRGPTETATSSPYTGELALRLFDHWSGRASFEWDADADTDQWRRRTLRLEYRPPEQGMLNLAYRADLTAAEANRYEDTDVSFRLPFGDKTRMELVGRWLYSIRHNESMDGFVGVEFGQCCWRMRVLGRHFKRRPEDAASTSVMVQIELAGLGAIGDPIGEFLERELYGYNID